MDNKITIPTKLLQDKIVNVMASLDRGGDTEINDLLEICAKKDVFTMSVTNGEYFVKVKFPTTFEDEFCATISATTFLKLASQITTDDITMSVDDDSLNIVGNGNYSIPIITDGNKPIHLNDISINNVTNEFNIDVDILHSIATYNSKEVIKAQKVAQGVQRMYYLDNEGCITFTTGACVNDFTLDKPIKLLLSNKVVNLFKLFAAGEVKFRLGYDELNGSLQTKMSLKNDEIELSAILASDESLITSVPVEAIRSRAHSVYNQHATLNKESLIQALNRLLLFSAGYGSVEASKPYCKFEFNNRYMSITDLWQHNYEEFAYETAIEDDSQLPYSCILDIKDLKMTLDGCKEQFVDLFFGDNVAIVISRNNVHNVIPEIHTSDE